MELLKWSSLQGRNFIHIPGKIFVAASRLYTYTLQVLLLSIWTRNNHKHPKKYHNSRPVLS